ncbi:uncharacterized protein EKO05_0011498 [Ascochyta rabiei]|uniref:uncharacterized protein n=1 Tax=Didymella rabiei TaxID=5454 RepID=UPI0022001A78|nr:uncharacterized protein EKO05_0011498 [Ascochyta rabiei]UPX21309.1 hypothetical protein EKO05_0011498 [Ascochyta rabiei]
MALPKAHLQLLNIPREVRDHIYSYLHRELELRTVERLGDTQVIFGLTNAPYPSVLRTHSRIHDEYKASHPFKHLSASATNIDHFSDLWKWHTDSKSTQQDNAALARLKHVILRFTHLPSPAAQSNNAVTAIIDALALTAPSLQSIMIGEFRSLQKYSDATLPKDLNYPAADKLISLPPQLQGLRLVQRVDCRWYHSFCAAPTPDSVTHSLFQVRMHTYSLTGVCRYRWTPGELESCRTPPGYPRLLRRVVREYKARMVEQKPKRILGWREEWWNEGCGAD